jgi:hypothetical protein
MPLHPFVVMFQRTTLLALLVAFTLPAALAAHCDTVDGPVVTAARAALESGDLTPLLRWVPAEAEPEIAAAYERTRQVRSLSAEARELADRWFFETVVRLHRAGEGEPYQGLAAPDAPVDAAVAAVDEALKTGAPERLVRLLTSAVEAGVRQRFAAAVKAKAHADESVREGRELVAAYVELTHYSERIRLLAAGEAAQAHQHEVGSHH